MSGILNAFRSRRLLKNAKVQAKKINEKDINIWLAGILEKDLQKTREQIEETERKLIKVKESKDPADKGYFDLQCSPEIVSLEQELSELKKHLKNTAMSFPKELLKSSDEEISEIIVKAFYVPLEVYKEPIVG